MNEEKLQLKILETYLIGPYSEKLGERRYRVQLVGTNIVVNIQAETPQEALEKAAKVLQTLGITKEFIRQP
ncbi:MAG: hypothetical protein F7C32_01130 [Desulfurococcales archaeon]|nr:hypothetical protein [Desulfurococcales archaeon]